MTNNNINVNNGDINKGEKLFKTRCAQCHTYTKDGENKQGPNLFGIFGRKSGSKSDYNYTEANKNAGIIWNDQTLFDYLENPKKYTQKLSNFAIQIETIINLEDP